MSSNARTATVLIEAPLVVDGVDVAAQPGCVLVRDGEILAAGSPEDVDTQAADIVLRRPGEVLIPALVNAHVHLDLTHVGPRPYEGDFVGWIDMVRRLRHHDEAEIAASVRRGLALAHAGGVAAVGDIAGAAHTIPIETLRSEGAAGVGFIEVFGTGGRVDEAISTLVGASSNAGIEPPALGLQPHAPYSCGREVYAAAAALDRPLATHLAESPAERELVASGSGPLADFLASVGAVVPVWGAEHPIDAILDVWRDSFLAVHVNDVESRHFGALAAQAATVVYCPRATDYFGHGPHAYHTMLEAGINVALGTDSIIVLDTPDRLSVLDEMRHLAQRDGTNARTLLSMATVAGAVALGLDPSAFTFRPGPTAGVLALPVDPADQADAADLLHQAIVRGEPPRWCVGPFPVGRAR